MSYPYCISRHFFYTATCSFPVKQILESLILKTWTTTAKMDVRISDIHQDAYRIEYLLTSS